MHGKHEFLRQKWRHVNAYRSKSLTRGGQINKGKGVVEVKKIDRQNFTLMQLYCSTGMPSDQTELRLLR